MNLGSLTCLSFLLVPSAAHRHAAVPPFHLDADGPAASMPGRDRGWTGKGIEHYASGLAVGTDDR